MCAAEVIKGEPAPFTGQLMTKELAIPMGQKADTCDVVTRREVDFVRKVERVEADRVQKLADVDKKGCDDRHAFMSTELDKATAWHRQPAFVIPVTMVVTIGIVLATGYAMGQVAPQ